MSTTHVLEIACFNLESALIAGVNGADRIELCENYKEGGLTPSFELIKEVRRKIQLPVHVIIRPRGGDFVYSDSELAKMEQEILFCKTQKINAVVFGVLTQNNEIDLVRCMRLVELARPMSVTFHRAIDSCNDLESSLTELNVLGVDRVLISGGKGNAEENIGILKKLQNTFKNKIILMPGGGIRSSNIKDLIDTGCTEFHSAAILSGNELADASEIKNLKQFLIKL